MVVTGVRSFETDAVRVVLGDVFGATVAAVTTMDAPVPVIGV